MLFKYVFISTHKTKIIHQEQNLKNITKSLLISFFETEIESDQDTRSQQKNLFHQ